jgi:hypothetical protein
VESGKIGDEVFLIIEDRKEIECPELKGTYRMFTFTKKSDKFTKNSLLNPSKV